MAEIAARAGVSKTTVSRVLNGKPDVDAQTAERVRALVEQTGYVRSASAVRLARGRTGCVGILLPSLAWPWLVEVMRGIAEELEDSRYSGMLFTMSQGQEALPAFTEHVSARSFDGLLAVEPPGMLGYVGSLHARGLPVVLIDDRGFHPEFPSVATTNTDGGRQAGEHLVGTGRPRIVQIAGRQSYGCVQARADGFSSGLGRAAGEGGPLTVHADFTEPSGAAAMRELLARVPDLDAVFAHNDLMAIAAMDVLRASGRAVPDDVAVVGFDDIDAARYVSPALTTVHQPLYEMGRTAARRLLEGLGGGTVAGRTTLPTSLVRRESA